MTSSRRDYAELHNVVDRLDMARRQVFIEAVIMDLTIARSNQWGSNFHLGDTIPSANGDGLVYGGLNPLKTIGLPDPTSLQGMALGIRGPGIPGSETLLGTGITIPAFGVLVNALAHSEDADVLSTPHILATDNVSAEINVGQNIPLQTNAGAGIGGLAGAAGGGAAGALGGLGSLGFGGGFAAPRQDVGTKIKVIPHLNESNEVRLELTEEISEASATPVGALGTIALVKRTAQTTLTVRDQQTVVIGGLMRNRVSHSEDKIPLLGDIPVLGALFRSTKNDLQKSNLILVLTPYIIREQSDLRQVFERKMQERQEFLDRYFVFNESQQYEAPHDWSRTNGLVEDIRQAYLSVEEQRALDELTKPKEVKGHEPGQPLEMPGPSPRQRGCRGAARGGRRGPRQAQHHAAGSQRGEGREVVMPEQRFLGEILARRGALAADRLEGLYAVQREKEVDLIDLMVNSNVSDEATIGRALAAEAELPYVENLEIDKISTALATRVPIAFAKTHRLLLLAEDDDAVHVACADPFDTAAFDDLRLLFGKPVDVSVAGGEKIVDSINRVYEREAGGGELESDDAAADEEAAGDILDSDDEAPVIRWVNSLFLQAMKERASDIHIEPEEKEVIVRYRIDGELYVARRAPRAFMNSIVSRIKIESALNIAEKRLPQDGRITKKIAGKSFDIRVSTIPTSRSYERIVMRLLNKSSVLLDLPDLGFSPRDYVLMDGLIRRPDGIILVTGPTGSGKTTTLYACINRINHPSINILTAEDPVEYEISGIHQVHVQPKIGLTFASALRSFLRQDPDVVMVGEIRDKETVDIAINASLTGHLVLSTIHTNDAAGAVTRMVDMGVEPFLIRSSVIGILAQRLVRVLCPHCKEAYEAEDSELDELGLTTDRIEHRISRRLRPTSRYYPRTVADRDVLELDPAVKPTFFKPKGCDRCSNTGFMGRRGIYELLLMDDAVGPLVLKNADAQTVKRAAIIEGMDSLRDDGARKVLSGLTSVEEVLAATQEDVEADKAPRAEA